MSLKLRPGKLEEFKKLYSEQIIPALHHVGGCCTIYLTERFDWRGRSPLRDKLGRTDTVALREKVPPFCAVAFIGTLLWLVMSGYSPSYAQLGRGHDKFLGNVYGNSPPAAGYDSLWNQMTPENAGKWEHIEIGRGVYNWSGLDQVYTYARTRGLPYKHHCLIWGLRVPSWMTGLDSANQRQEVEEWIRLVGQRYQQMDFVDVVNEAMHAPPLYKNAIGGDGATGWDWVIWAFQKARQYIPQARLVLNDYYIIGSDFSTTQYLVIINLLRTRGLIDAIGVQGHRYELENVPVSTMTNNLDRLAATGLPVYITEFDLGNIGNIGVPDDAQQLQLYQRVFPALWEHPGVRGITLWGYLENQIWQTTAFIVRSDGTERPALQWLRSYLRTPPLPIQLASFAGHYVQGALCLDWTTLSEVNNYGFFVQRKRGNAEQWMDIPQSFQGGHGTTTTPHHYSFTDTSPAGGIVQYRLKQIDLDGTIHFSHGIYFDSPTHETEVSRRQFSLSQGFPDPFNASTTISYQLPEQTHVTLVLYDVLGREVTTLVNEVKQPGVYMVQWHGDNMATGVYFYRLSAVPSAWRDLVPSNGQGGQAGDYVATKKLLLLR